jgi:glucose/mannose-6-phosphate isomerase
MSIFDDDLPDEPLEPESADGDDIVAVLDSESLIQARDPGRLLWSLATAGAQVRRALESMDRWRLDSLREEPLPRAVLVATDSSGSAAAAVLAALGSERLPVLECTRSSLPRWAGPADVLLVASVDGRHPRLAGLLSEGDRRGMITVAVSPPDSPMAAATGRGLLLDIDVPATRRAALWTVLTPLLIAAAAVRVIDITDEDLAEVISALDGIAESCRPSADAFTNPAKQLAIELAEVDLLIAGAGPLSAVAARWMRDSLALLAGLPSVAAALPGDMAMVGALLEITSAGGRTEGDFFRDRVAETSRRRRLVIVSESGVLGPAAESPDEQAAQRAAVAVQDIASARGIVTSAVEIEAMSTLARFAAATAFGDFTAAYAAIGRGVDPSAIRAGELAH